MKTFVLYGVAARDQDERVCMFFARKSDALNFRTSLPGRYTLMVLKNVDYDALTIGKIKDL